MARDAMAALLKLRGFATQEAKRALGAETQALAAAETESATRAEAPMAEQSAGADPLLLAAWMPRALMDRDRAAAQARRAAASVDAARMALAQARREERVLSLLAEQRAAEAAKRAARKAQAALDERAQWRHAQDEQ